MQPTNTQEVEGAGKDKVDSDQPLAVEDATKASSGRPKTAAADRPKTAAVDRPKTAAADRPKTAADRPRTAAADRPKTAAADRPKTAVRIQAGPNVSPHPRNTHHMGDASRPQTTASSTRLPSTSPFHDMDLDEIISPEMRLAVRRTLAMNQMLAEHEAVMKKYNAARRKQLAVASMLRAKGVEPCSPSGAQLTAEELLATSPRTLQAWGLSRSTTQQVASLAEELATDGSTTTGCSSSPGNRPPQLHLPFNILGRRGVQFRNTASPANQLQGASSTSSLQQQDMSDLASMSTARTGGSGTNCSSRPADQGHSMEGAGYDAWGEDPDIPITVPSTARTAPSSPRPITTCPVPLPTDEAQLLEYLEQQWAAQKVQQSTHPFNAPPLANLPKPEEGALPSDRSLTPSIVLRVVDEAPPGDPDYITRLQLRAQVLSRHGVYPPPDAVEISKQQAALDANPGHVACWLEPDSTAIRGTTAALQASSTTYAASVIPGLRQAAGLRLGPQTGRVPLSIQVFGCMAAKANGLDYVAQPKRRSVSPERSQMLPTCRSCPSLNVLSKYCPPSPPRQPYSPLLVLPPMGTRAVMSRPQPPTHGSMQQGSPSSLSRKQTAATAPHVILQPEPLLKWPMGGVTQHNSGQCTGTDRHRPLPCRHGSAQAEWPGSKLPLSSNLSLSFVRGDRVPRAGSKQALPHDVAQQLSCGNTTAPLETAVAAYARASLQRHALHSAPTDHRTCCMQSCLDSSLGTRHHERLRVGLPGRQAISLGGSMDVFRYEDNTSALHSPLSPAGNQLTAAAAALHLPVTGAYVGM